jgi:hypothetical protein
MARRLRRTLYGLTLLMLLVLAQTALANRDWTAQQAELQFQNAVALTPNAFTYGPGEHGWAWGGGFDGTSHTAADVSYVNPVLDPGDARWIYENDNSEYDGRIDLGLSDLPAGASGTYAVSVSAHLKQAYANQSGYGVAVSLISSTGAVLDTVMVPGNFTDEVAELQVSGLSAASVNGLTVRVHKALAGVVSTGLRTVTVYADLLDTTPPGRPSEVTATYDDTTHETEVTWNPAIDPALSDGTPGSGVVAYTYRYRRGGSAWSSWTDTQIPEFELTQGLVGEVIDVEVFATDAADNAGSVLGESDAAAVAAFTADQPGEYSGADLSGIEFSTEDEPAEPGDGGAPVSPGSIYRAEDYEEDNCDGSSPCGEYDYKAAARYARFWHDKRNSDYRAFGFDCTNFISQALKAGGMRFIRTGGFNDPTPSLDDFLRQYHKGHGSWWSANINGADDFSWTRSFTVTQSSYDRLNDFGIARFVASDRVRRGDLVYYKLSGLDRPLSHAAIVSRVTRRGVYVAQHTRDYERRFADVRERLNRTLGPGNWTYVFVRPTHRAYDLDQ